MSISNNLKLDINLKLDELDNLINKTELFLSDFFYSIRNEIDLQAESLLLKLDDGNENNEKPEVKYDDHFDIASFNEGDESNGYSLIQFDKEDINKGREVMINELNTLEKKFTQKLEKLKTNANFITYVEELKRKISKYREEVNSIAPNEMPSSVVVDKENESDNKDVNFVDSKSVYEGYLCDIENDIENFKSRIMRNTTIYFKQDFVHSFGILVVLEGIFFKDFELDYLKYFFLYTCLILYKYLSYL